MIIWSWGKASDAARSAPPWLGCTLMVGPTGGTGGTGGTVGPAGTRVLVALGGNAMSAPDGSATEAHQIAALTAAAEHLADLAAAGFQVAVAHGNGPQVGNLLVKN